MFKRYAELVCRISALAYSVVFFCWSSEKLLNCQNWVGPALQLLFIAGLWLWRIRRKNTFFFIPDQLLVCLPYFWSLANAGSAVNWFNSWKIPLIAVFAISVFNLPLQKGAFPGGLRKNSLLQAVVGSIVFVFVFVSAMNRFFINFPHELYNLTLLNMLVAVAGIPISLAAFYPLIAKVGVKES